MSFSIYSFLMAVLWSSVFVLLLCLCRRSRNLIVCLGVWPLLGVIVCTLARCFFPLEMLSFTHVVMGSELVTRVDDFLTSPVPGLAVMPLQFGGVVWILGSVFFFVRFLWSYGKFRKLLYSFAPLEEDDGSPYGEAQALAEQMGLPGFTIYMTGIVRSPTVTGFFHPIVLFPLYPYSSEDYQNALEHEFTHWINRDIWVKLLVELLRDIFWWNPLVYLLKYDLNQTLELKCDLTIAKKRDLDGRVQYVRTLESTAFYAKNKEGNFFEMFAIAELSLDGGKRLMQRADAILNYEHRPRRIALAMAFTSLIMAVLMIFSYSFVIQPCYEPPREEIEEPIGDGFYTGLSNKDSYLQKNEDGSYSVIHEGNVVASVSEDFAQFLHEYDYKIIDN